MTEQANVVAHNQTSDWERRVASTIAKGSIIMVADRETETDYLSIAEAAALLHVGEAAIRRWIDRGMLPAHCGGQRQIAVTRDDLTEFMCRAHPTHPFLGGGNVPLDAPIARRTTPEAREYGLAWIDEAERRSKELMNRLGIE